MVTSQTLDSFVVRETSLLTLGPSFQRQTSPQGRKQWLALALSITLVCHSQITPLSTHSWPLWPLDSWMHISSHGLSNFKVSPGIILCLVSDELLRAGSDPDLVHYQEASCLVPGQNSLRIRSGWLGALKLAL